MADPSHSPPSLDYAGGRVPVPSAWPAIGVFTFGVATFVLALLVRADLHHDLNPIAVLLWLVGGFAATGCLAASRRHGAWLDSRPTMRRAALGLVGLGWIAGVVGLLFPSGDPHASDLRRQDRCAAHFHQIATSIQIYAIGSAGRYPDRPEQLLLTGNASPELFICPSTRDTPATGATPHEIAEAFASGGHHSYIYVGKGLTTSTATRAHVVAYEPARNHTRERPGIHVLFGDGRVAYLEGVAASDLISRLARGENPPARTP